jgi:hypothetical protein
LTNLSFFRLILSLHKTDRAAAQVVAIAGLADVMP